MLQELLDRIQVERTDDIPLLLGQMRRMNLVAVVDRHFPTHANWEGELTFGEVTCVWLAFILSQADHCLNHVQPWAASRLVLLSACLGKNVRELDFHDDRLADILDALANHTRWPDLETDLNGHCIRVHDLPTGDRRIDTTTAFTFADGDDPLSIFQRGHSKDGRPDLRQIKICLSTLDPLGMPLACSVVAGNLADDPLYVPAIKDVQKSLPMAGYTYFGDCKMAALETRAYLVDSGDHYVCPLPATMVDQDQLDALLDAIAAGQELTEVSRPAASADQPGTLIARGYEYRVRLTCPVGGEELLWEERRFVVCSLAHQRQQQERLQGKLSVAQQELSRLTERKRGKRRRSGDELRQAVKDVLATHGVKDLLQVEVVTTRLEKSKRQYGARPAGVVVQESHELRVVVNEEALAKTLRRCGWRVYASNHAELSLAEVVLGYRGQYVVEGGFDRLKNQPLGLLPLYLQKDKRVVGLVHLLSLGLRVLTLLEFVVRRKLAEADETLTEVYAGQGGRQTSRPSAELLLRAFRGIDLYVQEEDQGREWAVKALTGVQQRILRLLDLPADLYSRLRGRGPWPAAQTEQTWADEPTLEAAR